ncbi:hypothetical protein [Plantactinospora endophytica]|uniref:Uncharacterized protein n=1 Tax=Plantactinospora endophytica TaxID=673535 RepID=A0ABQ4EE14_9ACTN|nr:hypothetical protein [Plantactinospora endophytica]GIG92924.1 hypothetical protein Pen02_78600 [Plantactinospora endophytica]
MSEKPITPPPGDDAASGDARATALPAISYLALLALGVGLLACCGGIGTAWFGDGVGPAALGLTGGGLVLAVGSFALVKAKGREWTNRAARPEVPPRRVASLAERYQLGEHLVSRTGQSPLGTFGLVLVCAAGLVGIAVGVNWLLDAFAVRRLAFVALLLVVVAVVLVPVALLVLPTKTVRTDLFSHGLVHGPRRRPRALYWHQIDRIVLWVAAEGKLFGGRVLGYHLRTTDGAWLRIEARPHQQPDPFGERLLAAAESAQLPVERGGPYHGEWRPRRS